jgi:conjugal transfer pilus assembly protein TraE
MKRLVQKSLLQYVIRHRNGYLTLACGSLLLNILLSLGMISLVGHERVIIVPPSISKTFWVDYNTVSPEYLYEMSLFFVGLRFDMTPSNAENQREVMLRYVSPEYYDSLKTQLINEAKQMSQEHISTAFYPNDVRVDAKHLTTLVIGDLASTVGTNSLPNQHVIYKITYGYHAGRLLVRSFDEVQKNA